MTDSKRMTETESEDFANEQAENRFALETMGPLTWEQAADSVNEDIADLLASDPDDLEILSDGYDDFLDSLDDSCETDDGRFDDGQYDD